MVYGYIRVSTDKQDCENQKLGIEAKAHALGIIIDKYVEDAGISGIKSPNERALGGILRKLKAGDIIICSEISRLGRKLFMIMEILQKCMNCGAKLYTVKDNYELGDNIQSKCLAFAFGLSAEIERDLISQRTKEAMARRRACGLYTGRKLGAKNLHHKLDGKEPIIQKLLSDGFSQRQIAKKLKVGTTTINTFINNDLSRLPKVNIERQTC
ncbi:MAG: recombinase family protein [Alphaproteobacteria bacterium]|nr:recombinase family protein [Alphaproteobacteria bacterium]